MSLSELTSRVRARTPLPGGLTVPAKNVDGLMGTTLLLLRVCLAAAGFVLASVFFWSCIVAAHGDDWGMRTGAVGAVFLVGGGVAAGVLSGLVARFVEQRAIPVRRALVLTPDGCVVGLPTGVRALRWSDVDHFRVDTVPDGLVLAVVGADGVQIGALHSQYLDGPVHLIAAVANTYREAAHG